MSRTPQALEALLVRNTAEFPLPGLHGGWLLIARHVGAHPVTQCQCAEGRVTQRDGRIVAWLPAVHACAYIAECDALRGDLFAVARLAGIRAGESVAAMARGLHHHNGGRTR